MMNNDKILGMIGLAMRAGKVVSGEFSVEKLIKSGKARLVIVATDASDNSKKLYKDKCTYYKVPVYLYSTKEKLGSALGKELRSSIAIDDAGFSKAIGSLLNKTEVN